MTINVPPPLRAYVAGPMRGIPHFNFPLFNAVTAQLRSQGHLVFNPAERDSERHGTDISADNHKGCEAEAAEKHGFCLRTALADDLDFITRKANLIVMLPGWEASAGAQAEHRTAVALQSVGMEIAYLSRLDCEAILAIHTKVAA